MATLYVIDEETLDALAGWMADACVVRRLIGAIDAAAHAPEAVLQWNEAQLREIKALAGKLDNLPPLVDTE